MHLLASRDWALCPTAMQQAGPLAAPQQPRRGPAGLQTAPLPWTLMVVPALRTVTMRASFPDWAAMQLAQPLHQVHTGLFQCCISCRKNNAVSRNPHACWVWLYAVVADNGRGTRKRNLLALMLQHWVCHGARASLFFFCSPCLNSPAIQGIAKFGELQIWHVMLFVKAISMDGQQ